MTDLPPSVDERIEQVLAELRKIEDPYPEKIAWEAIRAAYQIGYNDGLEIRAKPEDE